MPVLPDTLPLVVQVDGRERTARIDRLAVILPAAMVAAVILVSWRASDGAGLVFAPDTYIYLGSASALRDGHLFAAPFSTALSPVSISTAIQNLGHVPLAWCPPGFPLLVALAEVVTGRRGLQVYPALNALITVGVALVAWAIAGLISDERAAKAVAAITVTGTIALSPYTQFGTADYALVLAVLFATYHGIRWWREGGNVRALVWGASAIGVIALKFQGEFIIVAIAASILVKPGLDRSSRARAAACALGPGLAALGAWSLFGPGSPRRYAWHPPSNFGLADLLTRTVAQLSPTAAADVVGHVVVGISIFGLVAAIRMRRTSNVAVPILTALSLPPFLYAAAALADRNTGLRDARLLLPTRALLLIVFSTAAVGCVAELRRRWTRLPGREMGAMIFLLPTVAVVLSTNPFVHAPVYLLGEYSPAGQLGAAFLGHPPQLGGHSSLDRDLEALVEPVAGERVIFSDAPEAIWISTQRPALAIPDRVGATDGEPTPGLSEQISVLQSALSGGAVVIWCGVDPLAAIEPVSLQLRLDATRGGCQRWVASGAES